MLGIIAFLAGFLKGGLAMAKFYSRSVVNIVTLREDGGVSDVADVEYRVRDLGRGRWSVEREDGYHRVLRTAEAQRFFRPHSYECGYWSSGEPIWVYERVYITRA